MRHSELISSFLKNTSQGQTLLSACEKLGGLLPEAKIYLVGGALREILVGGAAVDFDLEVFDCSSEQVLAALESLKLGPVHVCGRQYQVVKWCLQGLSEPIDVTFAKGDESAAVARRDFTVNALMWNLQESRLLDLVGGQEDLQQRKLSMVSEQSFVQDPLRVLRAAQFAARLGFTIDSQCESLCRRLVEGGELDGLPGERLTEEWRKLLVRAPQPSWGLQLMQRWGLIERLYPQLHALAGVPQDVRWHPEGDVWEHTLLVVDACARIIRRDGLTSKESTMAMFGALCHDLGKVSTTVVEEAPELPARVRVTAHGHEAAGLEPAQALLGQLTLGQEVEEAVFACVTEHMRPGSLEKAWLRDELSPSQLRNAFRKLLRDTAQCPYPVFMAVCEADRRGRGPESLRVLETRQPCQLWPDLDAEFPNGARELFEPLWQTRQQLQLQPGTLLQGRDLVPLGVKPGRRMGELIGRIEHERDAGTVSTKEEALELVGSWLSLSGTP